MAAMAIAAVGKDHDGDGNGVLCRRLLCAHLLRFLVPVPAANTSQFVAPAKNDTNQAKLQNKCMKSPRDKQCTELKDSHGRAEDKGRLEVEKNGMKRSEQEADDGLDSADCEDEESDCEDDYSVQSEQYPLLAAVAMVLKQVMVKPPKLSSTSEYTDEERLACQLFDSPLPEHQIASPPKKQIIQPGKAQWKHQWKHASASSQDIFDFSVACFRIARWSMESHVYALVLILRVVKTTPIRLHYGNWRRLLLASLLISQKLSDDVPLRNKEFPVVHKMVVKLGNPLPIRQRVCIQTKHGKTKHTRRVERHDRMYNLSKWHQQQEINLKQINKMEITLLQLVDYDAFVSTATYYQVRDELMLMQKGTQPQE
jgi:hypothetical protein